MLPDLPATYVRHAVSPYGLRECCTPNAAGEIGSMVGGLGVRVSLEYECTDDNGARIKDACGRSFGGYACVAPLSWLLTTLRGRTWEDAGTLTVDDILDGLCEGNADARAALPDAVHRGAEFAIKAMRRALGIAVHGMPADIDGDGVLVCRCLGVGDRAIREAVAGGADSATAIGAACKAGTGCGSCRPDLLVLLDEETAEADPEPSEHLHPVARIALARAGPTLRALGLPLVSVEVEGDVVRIQTGTAGPEALLTPTSAPYVVRQVLRDTVGAGVEVVHV